MTGSSKLEKKRLKNGNFIRTYILDIIKVKPFMKVNMKMKNQKINSQILNAVML